MTDTNYLSKFNPEVLLGDRLELTIYGMFVEAYLKGNLTYEVDMYNRFIKGFPGEMAEHTVNTFIALIDSIREHGFNLLNPIMADPSEFKLLNGSHRSAIAIQLGLKDLPFILRHRDDYVSYADFNKILGDDYYRLAIAKQDEYISRTDSITQLRCEIRRHMRFKVASFQAPFSSMTTNNCLRLYQSYMMLGIVGKRSTEIRLRVYGLSGILNKDMDALEIGCNVGFLSLEVSRFVREIDAFDINPDYIWVAKRALDHLQVTNCNFFASGIHDFCSKKKYDVIMCTAIHGWVGLSFDKFIVKICEFATPTGVILIESHELDVEYDWPSKRQFLIENFHIIREGIIDDSDKSVYESEFRQYILLKKIQGYDYSLLRYSFDPAPITTINVNWMNEIKQAGNSVYLAFREFSIATWGLLKKLLPPSLRFFIKKCATKFHIKFK